MAGFLAVVTAVAGCSDSKKEAEQERVASARKSGKQLDVIDLGKDCAGEPSITCEPADDNADFKTCNVTITQTGKKFTVSPYRLHVRRELKKEVHLKWELAGDDKPYFDKNQGDGVLFGGNAEFTDKGVSKTQHKWLNKNGFRAEHKYKIQFRTETAIYRCDPTINNEGGV
ncbi:MAG TPA: hypothetical protein VF169_23725 [Albitalea sp.]|uniref:hypothetical protein n=1 Tax=Piscinibacter sp. TaxID=1903157 RepID=UPI002ED695CB